MPFAQRHAEEEALNRPIAAAQYLQALARGMPNNDVDLDHPPSDLTADQSAVIDYVRNTPALRNALDVAGIGGKADGIISANDCDIFMDHARDHADAASKAYNAYLGAHPNADRQSSELTRSAAVLAANQSLLAAAARSYDPGTGSRSAIALVDNSDLSSLAQANTEQLSL
jgi:hypothetical protein